MKFNALKWSAQNSAALKSALSFLIIGILWIAFSDRIAGALSPNQYVFEQIEMIKGWFFILVTSLLLFFIIRRYIIKDITERKISEQALHDSKLTLKELIELLPQNVFETDLNGILTFGNLAGFEMFGYKPEDISKGLSIFDMIIPEDIQRAKESIQKVFKGETRTSNEYTAVKSDGTRFPVMIFSNPIIREGKPIGIRGILIDITERKKAEEQIRKLSTAVEQSASSIIITDIDGRIEYVNPKFTEVTGYSLTEVKGKNPKILSSGEKPKSDYKELWDSILCGKEWKGEFHNKKKNGELYWESASISPIKDASGNITHFIALKEDITSQKMLSRELIAAKERAEESDRLKSEFLAQMSHEIRTPLNIILSYSSLLKEEAEELTGERYDSMFSSIDSAGKRLLRTINSILNMSSLQSGNLKINFSRVDAGELIKNLLIEFSNTAVQKGIKIFYNSITEKTSVLTDEYVLSEILQNLIDNAIKYTEKGEVEIKLYPNDLDGLNIDVRDTGIGISQNYIPKLFHPFTQEEGGYTRKYEGNGLGLALVKNYVDLIGAEINVQSQKGEGTTFTLKFNHK